MQISKPRQASQCSRVQRRFMLEVSIVPWLARTEFLSPESANCATLESCWTLTLLEEVLSKQDPVGKRGDELLQQATRPEARNSRSLHFASLQSR
jgi:hypothetical protein